MSSSSAAFVPPASHRRGVVLHRWIRQLHLWIGAWGALAAVLYGSTGLIMSHRFGDNAWPQGESEPLGKTELAVPAHARSSAEALSLWLRDTQGLDAQVIRKPKPGERPGERSGERPQERSAEQSKASPKERSGERSAERSEARREAPRWSLSGGTASESWSVEYMPGHATAELKRTRHTTLSALTRLHKAVGGGPGWRVLGDSFAIGMILLGLSGLWLWARGRSLRQMLLSVLSASVLAMALVLIPNLL